MIYVVIAVVILIIVIKIKNRNYVKVIGKIIRFEEENNKHYPVFYFETKDGQKIEARCKKFKDEASVEDVFEASYASNYLERPLPIEEVTIHYNKNNYEDFTPKWI